MLSKSKTKEVLFCILNTKRVLETVVIFQLVLSPESTTGHQCRGGDALTTTYHLVSWGRWTYDDLPGSGGTGAAA